MTWTGRQRLEKLADYLETTEFAPGKFHLALWMGSYAAVCNSLGRFDEHYDVFEKRAQAVGDEPAFEIDLKTCRAEPVDCKTAGCAVGWGAVGIPEFREQGLYFVADRLRDEAAVIAFNGKIDMIAVKAFFEIADDNVVHKLFHPWAYPNSKRADPKAVSRRIRDYLKHGHVV